MPLRCPRCRSLVDVPDHLHRYFGMPVACHLCSQVFTAPPQSPLHDNDLPQSLVRSLDRSISVTRCHHERSCPSCQRRVRLPGLDPAIGPLDLSCPYCRARFTLQGSSGVRPQVIAVALGLGMIVGLVVLWLDHEGLIALHQLRLPDTLLDRAQQARQWITGWL